MDPPLMSDVFDGDPPLTFSNAICLFTLDRYLRCVYDALEIKRSLQSLRNRGESSMPFKFY